MPVRFWRWQRNAAPYLFLSPFLGLFLLFFVYPLVRSLALSFCVTPGPHHVAFAGLKNYLHLLHDDLFKLSVLNTAAYVLVYLLVQVPASLVLALALNHRLVRGRNSLRFAFFCTTLLGQVFAAIVFGQFLNPRHDPIALILSRLCRHPVEIPWLSHPVMARLAVLLAWWWLSIGFGMVYLLAALQSVDHALYDAAAVDGAGRFARFRHVTLPGIQSVLMFLITVGAIGGFQLFELPYILVGNQGPGPGWAAVTVVAYMFSTGFQQGNLAYASAVGWALVLIIATATAPLWWLGRRSTDT